MQILDFWGLANENYSHRVYYPAIRTLRNGRVRPSAHRARPGVAVISNESEPPKMNPTQTTLVPIASVAATDGEGDEFERHFVMVAPARPATVRSITSEQLFADYPEVQIAHGDAVYRLRQTSLGKLILTK